jgi:hypothetical protein
MPATHTIWALIHISHGFLLIGVNLWRFIVKILVVHCTATEITTGDIIVSALLQLKYDKAVNVKVVVFFAC